MGESMVNPKPFYDSIEETLNERLIVAMDKACSVGYQRGLKDGYRKAQEDRVKSQTEAFGRMLDEGNNG